MTYQPRQVPDFRAIARQVFDLRKKIEQVQLTGIDLRSSNPWQLISTRTLRADRAKVERYWPPLHGALQQLYDVARDKGVLSGLIEEIVTMNPGGHSDGIKDTMEVLTSIPNEISAMLSGGNGEMPFIPEEGHELDCWLKTVATFAENFENAYLGFEKALAGVIQTNRPSARFPPSPLNNRTVENVRASKYL